VREEPQSAVFPVGDPEDAPIHASAEQVVETGQLAPVSAAWAATAVWLGLLGLISTPILLDRLGTSAYAVFALLTLMTAYLSNLEFGFGAATGRFLARARAQRDDAEAHRVLSTSLLVFTAAGTVAAALAFFGADTIVRSFADFPPAVEDDAAAAIQIGAAILAFTFLSSFASVSLQALGAFRVLVTSKLVFGTLSSALAIATAILFEDVRAVVLAQVGVALAMCVVLLSALRRSTGLPLRPRFHSRTFRVMGGFSLFILGAGLAYQVMIQGPPTVLAGSAPSAEVAAFAVPALVLQQLTLLTTSASLSFFPFASARSADEDPSHLSAVFSSYMRLTILVMAPIAAFLVAFADPLLTAWVDEEFSDLAAGSLQLLAIAALVLALSGPPADVARGLGKPSWVLAFTTAGAIVGLGTTLVAVDSLGATGAALGLLAGLAVATPPFIVAVARGLLNQSAGELASRVAPPVAAAITIGGLFWLGSIIASGFWGAVAVGAVLTPLYAILGYRLVLDERERTTLRTGFRSRLRRGSVAPQAEPAAEPR
jgi:O-antigen/teichoic acid export membrane protein